MDCITFCGMHLALTQRLSHKQIDGFATLWQTFAIIVAKLCQSVARPV